MRFEFATAQRILFGPGTLAEAAPIAASLGRRALLVTGRDLARSAGLCDQLRGAGLEVISTPGAGEPTVEAARAGAQLGRECGCDLVIGMGGGSALDLAKALAALIPNDDVMRYLEVVGEGRALEHPPLPCMAIPTTAGTGSEVTRNAVLASTEHRVKASLRHPAMLPAVAIVDPLLTHDLPPEVTASTGLDALTQLIEPFVSTKANPMTDAFCREGIRRSARSLERAFREGHNAEAREDLALASLLGGLALANAGLGAVHGLAAPLGGQFPIPHGAACAALLTSVMETNVSLLRASQDPAAFDRLARYAEVAVLLTGRAQAEPEDGIAWIRQCVSNLQIPGLAHWGITPENFADVIEKALQASSMKANPVPLTRLDLEKVLRNALLDAAR